MNSVTDLLKIRNVERVLDGLRRLTPDEHFDDVTNELTTLLWEIPENETTLEILGDLGRDSYSWNGNKYTKKLEQQRIKKQGWSRNTC